jgi:copper chaperone NosL
MMRRAAAIVFILCATACSGEVVPAAVTTSDVCANCRMTVLNPQFAAQVVAPGEDAMFFDDIG